MGSLDISLGTKREIQLVGLHSSFPVRLDGMILKVGQKKENTEDLVSWYTAPWVSWSEL